MSSYDALYGPMPGTEERQSDLLERMPGDHRAVALRYVEVMTRAKSVVENITTWTPDTTVERKAEIEALCSDMAVVILDSENIVGAGSDSLGLARVLYATMRAALVIGDVASRTDTTAEQAEESIRTLLTLREQITRYMATQDDDDEC
jgi:hypothetical protein